jgi:D-amino-acid dehydrogenase
VNAEPLNLGQNQIMQQKADIVVIGGGAIGICCAYYLTEQGRHVTLVEKGDICSGCSCGNAGLIVPSYSIPLAAPGLIIKGLKWMFNPESPFYIKPRLHRDFLSWLWKFRGACNEHHVQNVLPVLRDLSFESLQLFDDIAELDGTEFGYEKKGIVKIFKTHKGFEEGVKNSLLLQKNGIDTVVLDANALSEFSTGMKTSAVGGIFFPRDAHLIPEQFVDQLAGYLRKKGSRILTSTEVIGLKTKAHRVTSVMTTRGDIAADEVVLAGGSWSTQIARDLKIRLFIESAKGYSVTFKRPYQSPLIPFTMAEASVVLTPMKDMLRIAGTLELAGFDQSMNRRRLQAILKAVSAYFPEFDYESLDLVEIWRGLRPCTPDGLPYLGRLPRYDNATIAAGHGMLGISLAPITGKIVAQLIANETPAIDLTPLRVERFH